MTRLGALLILAVLALAAWRLHRDSRMWLPYAEDDLDWLHAATYPRTCWR